MKFTTVIALCFILVSQVAGANDVLSELEARIKSEGPRTVLMDIWNTEDFGAVLDGIASGDERWLEVGLKLRSESDAGITSMLREYFALALVTAPSLVLKAQKEGRLKFTIEELCGSAFIDEPAIGYATYFSNADLLVSGMKEQSLNNVKKSCIEALRKGREIYLKMSTNPDRLD